MEAENIKPIRVMLVDDHTMVRRGLATFLKVYKDLTLAGEAENGEAAVQICGEVQPDVILMDMVLPKMDGAEAIREIRKKFPKIQIIALTSFKEEKIIKSALEAGAIGYLLKDVSADILAQAIRDALLVALRSPLMLPRLWSAPQACRQSRGWT